MQPVKINYKVYQGSTFQEQYRWESSTKVYVPVTAIAKSAPCVITTQSSPGLPPGWRFKVVGAGGMKEINNSDSFYLATAVNNTANTITINSVNSLQYTAYTTGGVVEYNEPVNLSGFMARMQIRETLESNVVIYEATSQDNEIVIDNTLKTITITIPASTTAQFDFETAVYSLELYDNAGQVIPFLVGNLTLVPEVTRNE